MLLYADSIKKEKNKRKYKCGARNSSVSTIYYALTSYHKKASKRRKAFLYDAREVQGK